MKLHSRRIPEGDVAEDHMTTCPNCAELVWHEAEHKKHDSPGLEQDYWDCDYSE